MRVIPPVILALCVATAVAAQDAAPTPPDATLEAKPGEAATAAPGAQVPETAAAAGAQPDAASADPAVAEPVSEQAGEMDAGDFRPDELRGRIEEGRYYSPTEAFDIAIPMLVGDRPLILDNPNIVVFRDDVRTMLTIAAIKLGPFDKWEYETTSPRDFLIQFFRENVLADYSEAFPGTSVESARLVNDLERGALLVNTLHPNGSAFEVDPIVRNDPNTTPPVAKRGNLLFVHGDHVFVISS